MLEHHKDSEAFDESCNYRRVIGCWDLEFPVLGDSNMSPQSSVTKMISFSLRALGPPIISSFNQTQLASKSLHGSKATGSDPESG